MRKLRKSLFIKLIYGYIVFTIILLLSIVISYGYTYSLYQKTTRDGELINIDSNEILKDDATLKEDSSFLISNESWLELLDEFGDVVDIKGKKKDGTMHYEEGEINNLKIRTNNSYYTDILEFKDSKENTRYCLVKYSRGAVSFKAEITRENREISIINEQGIRINGIVVKGIVVFFILCILDAVMLSFWINRKVKKPLDYIGRGFEEISSGNLDVRLNFKAEDEFMIIEEQFNHMAERLKESINEKNRANESKKLMLLNLSHDIKTPLTTIRGYITVLNEGYINDKVKIKKYYKSILLKTERITNLVNQMFDLLKIENDKYELDLKNIDIFELLREIIASSYNEIEDNKMEIELNVPEVECIKNIDINLIERVFENILYNSIKYSEENTKIKVSAYENNDKAHIIFQDEGKGIPDEIKDTLFEPFVLGDSVRQTCSGNGLGLAIVKAIIEKHNGEIKYIDTECGAKFEIII